MPDSVGAFGSLTSLALPDGVSPLPPSGCTAELAAIEFFRFRCLSGAEVAAGLDLTASVGEVAALLDFCVVNPDMAVDRSRVCFFWESSRLDWSTVEATVCAHTLWPGGESINATAQRTSAPWRVATPLCGSGTIPGHGAAQWGNGDPCSPPGWYGVTCDTAGRHVTKMYVPLPPAPPYLL